jgi:hypothetical protein
MTRKDKIIRTVTAIVAAAVLICSIVIVTLRLGLVEGYDFGAGAYYYADIPGFEKIMNDEAYKTSVPVWVHILLFLSWGWLMYRLWVWIDSRK